MCEAPGHQRGAEESEGVVTEGPELVELFGCDEDGVPLPDGVDLVAEADLAPPVEHQDGVLVRVPLEG
jgi:hypothetical protein